MVPWCFGKNVIIRAQGPARGKTSPLTLALFQKAAKSVRRCLLCKTKSLHSCFQQPSLTPVKECWHSNKTEHRCWWILLDRHGALVVTRLVRQTCYAIYPQERILRRQSSQHKRSKGISVQSMRCYWPKKTIREAADSLSTCFLAVIKLKGRILSDISTS